MSVPAEPACPHVRVCVRNPAIRAEAVAKLKSLLRTGWRLLQRESCTSYVNFDLEVQHCDMSGLWSDMASCSGTWKSIVEVCEWARLNDSN